MEIRVLRYFLTVAREENITKAAEVLHITQPALSRQLAQLEEELGVKLFDRGTRKITLTDEGMLLRRRGEEIVQLVAKTENELIEQERLLEGKITIGCGEILFLWHYANEIAIYSRLFSRYSLYGSSIRVFLLIVSLLGCVAGLYSLWQSLFKGTDGPNAYGPDPLA